MATTDGPARLWMPPPASAGFDHNGMRILSRSSLDGRPTMSPAQLKEGNSATPLSIWRARYGVRDVIFMAQVNDGDRQSGRRVS